MKIIEALKEFNSDIRLTNSDKWLVWNLVGGGWTVYQHKKYSKKVKVLIVTTNEEEAIKILMEN